MVTRFSVWRFGAAATLVLLSSPFVWAQATSAINGRVVDQAGAVLPGVAVTVTSATTGATRETVTNGEGLYTVPALIPGVYNVKVELAGFAGAETKGVEVATGATLTVDVAMRLASLQETVTVTAQSPLVEATQASLSASIRQSEVVQLPMLNRSMAALMNLLPGAREVGGAVSAHGNASTYVSFSGGSGQNYNMLVDGIDNKEDHCGGASIVYSLEGIQEFRTVSTGASAEYGKGTTTVLMATKSGTNQLRGTVAALRPQPGHDDDRLLLEAGERRNRQAAVQALAVRRIGRRAARSRIARGSSARSNGLSRTTRSSVRPGLRNELQYLVPLNIGVAGDIHDSAAVARSDDTGQGQLHS